MKLGTCFILVLILYCDISNVASLIPNSGSSGTQASTSNCISNCGNESFVTGTVLFFLLLFTCAFCGIFIKKKKIWKKIRNRLFAKKVSTVHPLESSIRANPTYNVRSDRVSVIDPTQYYAQLFGRARMDDPEVIVVNTELPSYSEHDNATTQQNLAEDAPPLYNNDINTPTQVQQHPPDLPPTYTCSNGENDTPPQVSQHPNDPPPTYSSIYIRGEET